MLYANGFAFAQSIGATEIVSSGTGCLDTGQFMYQKGTTFSTSLGNRHIENWGDSGLADNSQQTDTSTDVDTDDKNQVLSLFLLYLSFICCCNGNIEHL